MSNERCILLGIESSCDETSAAVVADGSDILSNVVLSQVDEHAVYGGVVPEIASRAHIEAINGIVRQAMNDAHVQADDIAAVAAVHTPGLVGSLLIGVTAAKTLSWLWNVPLVGVDHIAAHAHSATLGTPGGDRPEGPFYPAVALVVSGGHTDLYEVDDPLHMRLLGSTTDDAAGECFDKVAAILELGYPGGPIIERLAKDGDAGAYEFPQAMLGRDSLDFSYSGLKTAVLYAARGQNCAMPDTSHLSGQDKANIAASFQSAALNVLVTKTKRALDQTGAKVVLLGGGVACNEYLRTALADMCRNINVRLLLPDRSLCTDNAAMVAAVGYHRFKAGLTTDLDLQAIA